MRRHEPHEESRGFTLVELLVAILVLTVGILAVGGLFPTGQRAGQNDRMLTIANQFAQQKIEELQGESYNSTALAIGRHPAGTATESLGQSGAYHRSYEVSTVTGLSSLKRVDVTVSWVQVGTKQVTATTYLRR